MKVSENRKGKKGTIENLFHLTTSNQYSITKSEIAGRSLWRRGLNIQKHKKRIEEEEKEQKQRDKRLKETLDECELNRELRRRESNRKYREKMRSKKCEE